MRNPPRMRKHAGYGFTPIPVIRMPSWRPSPGTENVLSTARVTVMLAPPAGAGMESA